MFWTLEYAVAHVKKKDQDQVYTERQDQKQRVSGNQLLLLMAEILHHLGCIKPWKQWDKLNINCCRISSINSMGPSSGYFRHLLLRIARSSQVPKGHSP